MYYKSCIVGYQNETNVLNSYALSWSVLILSLVFIIKKSLDASLIVPSE